MSNPWPSDLFDGDVPDLPIKEVFDAADSLKGVSNGVFIATMGRTNKSQNQFVYDFDIFVPKLDYEFTLFSCMYNLSGLPVYFSGPQRLMDDLQEFGYSKKNLYQMSTAKNRAWIVTNDHAEVKDVVSRILNSESTRKTFETLIGQMRLKDREP